MVETLRAPVGDMQGPAVGAPYAEHKFNIPVSAVSDATDLVRRLYGGRAVLVGGRAVNALTRGVERRTNDIDIVVEVDPKRLTSHGLDELQKRAAQLHLRPNGNLTKLFYDYKQGKDARHAGIDVFFVPGDENKETYADTAKASGRVSGVPISEILKYANLTVPVDGFTLPVAAAWQIIIMKYNVLLNEKEKADPQHRTDLAKLIEYCYPAAEARYQQADVQGDAPRRSDAVDTFISQENARILEYIGKGYVGRNISGVSGDFQGDTKNIEQFRADLKRFVADERGAELLRATGSGKPAAAAEL